MITFSAATVSDIPAIVPLVESAYRGDASRKGWTTEADLLDGQRIDSEGVREIILKADSKVVLAWREGSLVGCVHVEKVNGVGYFGMFSVDPTQQGGGVGDALLREAERVAHMTFACPRMTCTVIPLRAVLIAWYQRRGYVSTGEFKPFPYGDERFGVPKRADLNFEVFSKDLGA